jgi:mono/diheme cytochrome c family protein
MTTRRFGLVASAIIGVTSTASSLWAGEQSAEARRRLDGDQLFHSYCAPCHGADGKGRGPAAAALKTPPADLTAIARRNGGAFPQDRVARYVEQGGQTPSITAHGSKEMPVWGANFVALAGGSSQPINQRIEAVVAHIRSIQTEK